MGSSSPYRTKLAHLLPGRRSSNSGTVGTAIDSSGGRHRIDGPLTLATVASLLDEVRERFQGPEIRVDLSGVTQADSAAVGMLLAWVRDASARSHRIRFENLNENLRSLIALYGVGELIPGA